MRREHNMERIEVRPDARWTKRRLAQLPVARLQRRRELSLRKACLHALGVALESRCRKLTTRTIPMWRFVTMELFTHKSFRETPARHAPLLSTSLTLVALSGAASTTCPPIGHLYGCKDNSLALGPVGASGLRIEWLTP